MSPFKFQILLIDDAETDATLFATALKEAAPRVKLYWVATPEEGMEYIRQQNRFKEVAPVDLIICDLNLPGETGFEFLAQVKRDRATATIPLVIYSGSTSPDDVYQCYAMGANSYLVKPMTLGMMVSQLKALVHYWLEIVRLPEARMLD
jgi:CheY-like chemotaxis protein